MTFDTREEDYTWGIVEDEVTGLPKLPHWMYWELKLDRCRTYTGILELKVELHNTYTERQTTPIKNKFGGWFGRPEYLMVEQDVKLDRCIAEGWLSDMIEVEKLPCDDIHEGEWHRLLYSFDASEDNYQCIRPIDNPSSAQIYEVAREMLSRFLDSEVERQAEKRKAETLKELVGKYPPKKLTQEEK